MGLVYWCQSSNDIFVSYRIHTESGSELRRKPSHFKSFSPAVGRLWTSMMMMMASAVNPNLNIEQIQNYTVLILQHGKTIDIVRQVITHQELHQHASTRNYQNQQLSVPVSF